jgi:hypothetical protein
MLWEIEKVPNLACSDRFKISADKRNELVLSFKRSLELDSEVRFINSHDIPSISTDSMMESFNAFRPDYTTLQNKRQAAFGRLSFEFSK